MFNHSKIYGRHGQSGDPTGEQREAGNDAMDDLNHTVLDLSCYQDITSATWESF